MHTPRILILTVLIFLCVTAFAEQPARDVTLKSKDGTALAATYYSAQKRGPAVILLHQCNRDRKSWQPLAAALSKSGINVLTLDFRGYGESQGERYLQLPPNEQGRWVREVWPGDVEVAFDYLRSQKEVKADQIGAGGASCGVNQSIHLAMRHPEVRSLALLSGNTDRAGRKYLTTANRLPLLMAAADDDGLAAPQMKWLMSYSPQKQNRFIEYKEGGHGSELFAPHPDLVSNVTDWFWMTLAGRKVNMTAGGPLASDDNIRYWKILDEPGGVQKTTQMLAEARKRNPAATVIPEAMVNQLGYERIQEGDNAGAIEILKLNVLQFPKSSNAYDSLGDAYLAAGQKDLAKDNAEKAIAALPEDASADTEDRRKAIRESAEQKLKTLNSGP
jgi:dienelactone hydrolase